MKDRNSGEVELSGWNKRPNKMSVCNILLLSLFIIGSTGFISYDQQEYGNFSRSTYDIQLFLMSIYLCLFLFVTLLNNIKKRCSLFYAQCFANFITKDSLRNISFVCLVLSVTLSNYQIIAN